MKHCNVCKRRIWFWQRRYIVTGFGVFATPTRYIHRLCWEEKWKGER